MCGLGIESTSLSWATPQTLTQTQQKRLVFKERVEKNNQDLECPGVVLYIVAGSSKAGIRRLKNVDQMSENRLSYTVRPRSACFTQAKYL